MRRFPSPARAGAFPFRALLWPPLYLFELPNAFGLFAPSSPELLALPPKDAPEKFLGCSLTSERCCHSIVRLEPSSPTWRSIYPNSNRNRRDRESVGLKSEPDWRLCAGRS